MQTRLDVGLLQGALQGSGAGDLGELIRARAGDASTVDLETLEDVLSDLPAKGPESRALRKFLADVGEMAGTSEVQLSSIQSHHVSDDARPDRVADPFEGTREWLAGRDLTLPADDDGLQSKLNQLLGPRETLADAMLPHILQAQGDRAWVNKQTAAAEKKLRAAGLEVYASVYDRPGGDGVVAFGTVTPNLLSTINSLSIKSRIVAVATTGGELAKDDVEALEGAGARAVIQGPPEKLSAQKVAEIEQALTAASRKETKLLDDALAQENLAPASDLAWRDVVGGIYRSVARGRTSFVDGRDPDEVTLAIDAACAMAGKTISRMTVEEFLATEGNPRLPAGVVVITNARTSEKPDEEHVEACAQLADYLEDAPDPKLTFLLVGQPHRYDYSLEKDAEHGRFSAGLLEEIDGRSVRVPELKDRTDTLQIIEHALSMNDEGPGFDATAKKYFDQRIKTGSFMREDLAHLIDRANEHIIRIKEVPADEQQPIGVKDVRESELSDEWLAQSVRDLAVKSCFTNRKRNNKDIEYDPSHAQDAIFDRFEEVGPMIDRDFDPVTLEVPASVGASRVSSFLRKLVDNVGGLGSYRDFDCANQVRGLSGSAQNEAALLEGLREALFTSSYTRLAQDSTPCLTFPEALPREIQRELVERIESGFFAKVLFIRDPGGDYPTMIPELEAIANARSVALPEIETESEKTWMVWDAFYDAMPNGYTFDVKAANAYAAPKMRTYAQAKAYWKAVLRELPEGVKNVDKATLQSVRP